ncbi:MAG: hypothetical protein KDA61_07240 [Planctomycetales bacterium]|nr:hypothetical protein [Planctomycetales bacterium]
MHFKLGAVRFRTLAAAFAVVLLIVALQVDGQQRDASDDSMLSLLKPGQRVVAIAGGGGFLIHLLGEQGAQAPSESTLGPLVGSAGTLNSVSQDHLVIQLDVGWESYIATDAVTQIVVRDK